MATFTEIARAIGMTDKAGTVDSGHTYSELYDQWFKPYAERGGDGRAILEVGVAAFGGGCLLALSEYFNNAEIVGVDIDMSKLSSEVRTNLSITLIEADAYQPDWLAKIAGQTFDIILDDASHEVADQYKLLTMLRPHLCKGGMYIIEDVCTGHWLPRLGDAWNLGLRHTLVDMSTPRVYDNTLIRFDTRD